MSETRVRKQPIQREWRAQEIDWAFIQKALPYGACVYGIDQAAKRSAQANKARLLRGCKPGVADTYILWAGITVWLERKSGSDLSPAQEVFRDAVLANQGNWALIERTEDIELACVAAGIPLRATLGDIRTRIAEQNERLPAKPKRGPSRRAQTGSTMSAAAYRRGHEKGFW